jgi:hypothetical protein
MSDPAPFLAACIDEDEARANAMEHFTVYEQPYYSCAGSRTEPYGDLEWGEEHCDCFLAERKARALRKVAAHRAIFAEHKLVPAGYLGEGMLPGQYGTDPEGLCVTARALLSIWADNPGYDPAWAPAVASS